jgi:hypothetical protein
MRRDAQPIGKHYDAEPLGANQSERIGPVNM